MLKQGIRFFDFSSDLLLLSACLIFLFTFLEPFLTVPYLFPRLGQMPVIRSFTVTYWSYKAIIDNSAGTQVLIGNYWFGDADAALTSFLGISWVLATMFLLQIFTLIVGLISLLKIKKARFIPFVSSLAVMSLMIYVFAQTSKWTSGIARYEPGYLLTYLSIFLFFCAFMLSLANKHSNVRTRTQDKTHTVKREHFLVV